MTNYEELEKLAKLKEKGILSDEEFEIEKRKILGLSNNTTFKNNNVDYQGLSTYVDNSNHNIFQKFLSHKGRMNRGEYLIYYTSLFLFFMIGGLSLSLLLENEKIIQNSGIFTGIFIILLLFFVYSSYALSIKKLHDIDTSGWMSLLVVPLIPLSIFILLFIPGTKGDNRFGPNKGEDKVWTSLFIIIGLIILFTMLVGLAFNIYEKIQKQDNQIESQI